PHANWENPPLGGDGDAPYGKWLTAVFDRWYGAPRRETRIRLFEEIINGLLGGTPRTEAVGLEPDRVIVIETDGAIEQTDALKSAFEGASATGLHVTTDSFDDALLSPPIAARQLGSATLGPQCRACRL